MQCIHNGSPELSSSRVLKYFVLVFCALGFFSVFFTFPRSFLKFIDNLNFISIPNKTLITILTISPPPQFIFFSIVTLILHNFFVFGIAEIFRYRTLRQLCGLLFNKNHRYACKSNTYVYFHQF